MDCMKTIKGRKCSVNGDGGNAFVAVWQWHEIVLGGECWDRMFKAGSLAVLNGLTVRDGRHTCLCYRLGLMKTRNVVCGVCRLCGRLSDKGQGVAVDCSKDAVSSTRGSVH